MYAFMTYVNENKIVYPALLHSDEKASANLLNNAVFKPDLSTVFLADELRLLSICSSKNRLLRQCNYHNC